MARVGPRATEVAVVSPGEAAALRGAGAVVVDARHLRQRLGRGVGAGVVLGWGETCRGPRHDSALPDDRDALAARLRARGVPAGPVLVVDAGAAGWGEGARVAWVLAQLGHPAVAWLAGDARSLRAAAPGPLPSPPVVPVAAAGCDPVVLDLRSPREYAGATPYGEARGGHLPGALSLPYADLWQDGRPRSAAALRAQLASLGVPAGAPVRCVCTGGVRSAAGALLLRAAGVAAENDAGGMWAHAADRSVALVR